MLPVVIAALCMFAATSLAWLIWRYPYSHPPIRKLVRVGDQTYFIYARHVYAVTAGTKKAEPLAILPSDSCPLDLDVWHDNLYVLSTDFLTKVDEPDEIVRTGLPDYFVSGTRSRIIPASSGLIVASESSKCRLKVDGTWDTSWKQPKQTETKYGPVVLDSLCMSTFTDEPPAGLYSNLVLISETKGEWGNWIAIIDAISGEYLNTYIFGNGRRTADVWNSKTEIWMIENHWHIFGGWIRSTVTRIPILADHLLLEKEDLREHLYIEGYQTISHEENMWFMQIALDDENQAHLFAFVDRKAGVYLILGRDSVSQVMEIPALNLPIVVSDFIVESDGSFLFATENWGLYRMRKTATDYEGERITIPRI